MKICYEPHKFQGHTKELIGLAESIIQEYIGQGYDLTLRQLYYQMVARDYIPNTQRSYKRLGSTISNARRAGLLDWTAIVDRTRNLQALPHWTSPRDIMESAITSYHIDYWTSQACRVEVWIEKEALIGVIARICNRWDIPYFACRGYVSDSEMWAAGQRIGRNWRTGKKTIIIHLGDHDPSGIDMTRDIAERLELFSGSRYRDIFLVPRLALNIDQIDEYNPPPNPAKVTDSRFEAYLARYGEESWELDALDPATLTELIDDTLGAIVEPDAWTAALKTETEHKELLQRAIDWLNL
jgi:hypothetical protein